MATLTLEYRDPRELHSHPRNYRAHPPEQIKQIAKSLADFGQYKNIVVTPDGMVIAGHGVVQAAIEAGITELAVHVFDGDEAQVRRLMVADNELSRGAQDDPLALHNLLEEIARDDGDLMGTGWSENDLQELLTEVAVDAGSKRTGDGILAKKFGVPPFSVLDARQGYWQERKRAWMGLGIQSELGREE